MPDKPDRKPQVHLRLIDLPDEEGTQKNINVELTIDEEIWSEEIEYFPSKADGDIKLFLNNHLTYFLDNPLASSDSREDSIRSKLTRNGREIGERLLGSDLCLYTMFEKINKIGLEYCHVSFISKLQGFFYEPWEILIIPDTNQFLATSCASFTRKIPQDPKIESTTEERESSILNTIFLSPKTTSIGIVNKLFEFGESCKAKLLHLNSWEALESEISAEKIRPEAIHFEGIGKIEIDAAGKEQTLLGFKNEDVLLFISTADFSEIMVKNGILLLTLDIRKEDSDGASLSIGQKIALEISSNGVTSVVTTTQDSYDFAVVRLYQTLYTSILSGKILAEAVVETRKTLQLNAEQNPFTVLPSRLFDWPQIVHYGEVGPLLLTDPKPPTQLQESLIYKDILKKLAGFNHGLTQPHLFFGRKKEIQQMRQFITKGMSFGIEAHSGMGKTHLLNYASYVFAVEERFEAAFYFDFRYQLYDEDLILNMIGEFLLKDQFSKETTHCRLRDNSYLIIFDNIDEMSAGGSLTSLKKWVTQVKKGATIMIHSCGKKGQKLFEQTPVISLDPLPYSDLRQILVQDQKKKGDPNPKDENLPKEKKVELLIPKCQGNPYYLNCLALYPDDEPLEEVAAKFEKEWNRRNWEVEIDPIFALFETGWKFLKTEYQILYASFASLEKFISEGLPVAISTQIEKEKSAGEELFELLQISIKDPIQDFTECGTRAGFLDQKYDVKELHPMAPHFLKKKRDEFGWSEEKLKQIELIQYKLFSSELAILDSYLEKNQNSGLYMKITENHQRWFLAFERLWNEEFFVVYLNGFTILSKLLTKLGMQKQFIKWSWKILQSCQLPKTNQPIDSEKAIAWLHTAQTAIEEKEVLKSTFMKNSISYWSNHLKNDSENQSVNRYTMMFLETFYRSQNDWIGRRELSLLVLEKCEKKEDHTEMISALLSAAKCEEALDNMDACISYETRLLKDIPYDSLDPAVFNNTALALVNNRINRNEFDKAGELLEQIQIPPEMSPEDKAAPKEPNDTPFIVNLLKGKILIKQEKYAQAAPIILEHFKGITNREHLVQPDMTMKYLKELEEKMDESVFNKMYKEFLPSLPLPTEMLQNAKNQHQKK